MRRFIRSILVFSTFLFTISVQAQNMPAEKALASLKWRAIGPANMGGRVTDIHGIPGDPTTFYVSGADGGVFKTTNGGTTFEALLSSETRRSMRW